jgi:hypothetical protein
MLFGRFRNWNEGGSMIGNMIEAISRWIRPHLLKIMMAFTATILIVYGGDINRRIKRAVKGLHFVIRLSIFIVLCAFGYGATTLIVGAALAGLMSQLSDLWVFPLTVLMFLAIGLLAERKSKI